MSLQSEGAAVIFPAARMDAVTARITRFAIFMVVGVTVAAVILALVGRHVLGWAPVVLIVVAGGAAFLFCGAYAPRSYELSGEELIVHRRWPIAPAHVALKDIERVRRPTMIEQSLKSLGFRPHTVRLFGAGGFICNVGWFWTRGEGTYWISTRNIEKLVMLEGKEGKKKDEDGRRKDEGGSGKAEDERRSSFIRHPSSFRRRIVIGPEDPDRLIQALEAKISGRSHARSPVNQADAQKLTGCSLLRRKGERSFAAY